MALLKGLLIGLLIALAASGWTILCINNKYKRLFSEWEKLKKENAHLSAWQSVKYVPRFTEDICNINTITAEARIDYRDLRSNSVQVYEYTSEILAHELANQLKEFITIKEIDNPLGDPFSKTLRAEIKVLRPGEDKNGDKS